MKKWMPFMHLGLRAIMFGWVVYRLGGSASLAVAFAAIDNGTLLNFVIASEEEADER